MENFNGFAPYKKMLDSGRIEPGQVIVVEGFGYRALPKDSQKSHHNQVVYRVQHGLTQSNAKNLLKNKEWHVKGAYEITY
ncbi:MAG: hypothetical protein V1900_03780 [Candidatus Aenigmatarchaeota archaeon]